MKRTKKGFTLIEILLVVTIMGIMLAIIVPRAWRANTDAKYNVLRQHCTEIASYSLQWGEDQLRSQDEGSTATLADYIAYLCGRQQGFNNANANWNWAEWVATTGSASFSDGSVTMGTAGRQRLVNGSTAPPSGSAAAIVPQEKVMRNPFTGDDILNTPGHNPGAIAICGAADQGGDFIYSTLLFQSINADTTSTNDPRRSDFYGVDDEFANAADFIQGMRSGIFLGRYRKI